MDGTRDIHTERGSSADREEGAGPKGLGTGSRRGDGHWESRRHSPGPVIPKHRSEAQKPPGATHPSLRRVSHTEAIFPFIRSCMFQSFNYLRSTAVQKYQMKNSKKTLCKVYAVHILSSDGLLYHCTPAYPTQEPLCAQYPCGICYLSLNHLAAFLVVKWTGTCVPVTLVLFNHCCKLLSDMLRRSC